MSKSDEIRILARDGLPVAEIARRVGVRYQFAYGVLRAAGLLGPLRSNVVPRAATPQLDGRGPVPTPPATSTRPILLTSRLVEAGFEHAARWVRAGEEIALDRPLPKARGVYALAKDGTVLYVGLATMGLAKRLYFYGKPGATQRTSQRVNALLKAELRSAPHIDIYTATPSNLEWNGLPVSGDAGLELGLIETFALPWNIRGVRA